MTQYHTKKTDIKTGIFHGLLFSIAIIAILIIMFLLIFSTKSLLAQIIKGNDLDVLNSKLDSEIETVTNLQIYLFNGKFHHVKEYTKNNIRFRQDEYVKPDGTPGFILIGIANYIGQNYYKKIFYENNNIIRTTNWIHICPAVDC